MPDALTIGLLIVAGLALAVAGGALALVLHLRTRVYALEQLQGLTTRRIRVVAEHVGIPLAVERRRRHGRAPGPERRRPLSDGPVPEGLGGHPRMTLPVSGPRLSGDEQRLEGPIIEPLTGPQTPSGSANPGTGPLAAQPEVPATTRIPRVP